MIAAPFASILLRTEPASTSEVENLTSSAKQAALAEIGESRSGNARLVVANISAMKAAIDILDRWRCPLDKGSATVDPAGWSSSFAELALIE